MNNYSRHLLLFWIIAFTELPGMAQSRDYKGDVNEVTVIQSINQYPDASTVCIPHIAEWKTGHLVAACEVGIAGKSDMGDIVVSVSKDDGKSWAGNVTVFDHTIRNGVIQFAYANPVLYKDPEQDIIWCFAMRNLLSQRNSEESFLVAAYSGDGGWSWNQVELTMHYHGSLIITGNILRVMENGRPVYLLPAHRNSRDNGPVGGSRVHFVLRSTSLLSWHVAGFVPQPDSVFIHEGHIAAGEKPGEIKMVMRTADGENKAMNPPRAWSTVSTDNGATWSYPVEEPELWNSVSESAFGVTAQGTHYYIYNDGPAWVRKALKYKVKPVNGKWSEEKVFFDKGIHNSYPSVIEVAPGDLRVVWDSGDERRKRRLIHFGKLKIK